MAACLSVKETNAALHAVQNRRNCPDCLDFLTFLCHGMVTILHHSKWLRGCNFMVFGTVNSVDRAPESWKCLFRNRYEGNAVKKGYIWKKPESCKCWICGLLHKTGVTIIFLHGEKGYADGYRRMP